MDPEKSIHSPNLYKIGNEKSNWLKRASVLNPFHSNFFAWVDIGYFRSKYKNGKQILRHIPPSLQRNQVLTRCHVVSCSFQLHWRRLHWRVRGRYSAMAHRILRHVGGPRKRIYRQRPAVGVEDVRRDSGVVWGGGARWRTRWPVVLYGAVHDEWNQKDINNRKRWPCTFILLILRNVENDMICCSKI